MANLRKEVYIPIEIKPREFHSQLLLASRLALKGHRVFVGSKYAVDSYVELKTHNQGLYFYNPLVRWSLHPEPRQFLQSNLRALNVNLLNTDQEYILKPK